MKFKIKNNDIVNDIGANMIEYPKYTTQIMNLANQNSGGTRPKVVGQMSELIQEFPGNSYPEWVEWHQEKMPDAVENATAKILDMLEKLKSAIVLIDEGMVRKWAKDLVHTKTYTGLKFQESILKRVAAERGVDYHMATTLEEAKGIDGYIGNEPVSIKPESYKSKKSILPETIEVEL